MGNRATQPLTYEEKVEKNYLQLKPYFERRFYGPFGSPGPGYRKEYEYWKKEYELIQGNKEKEKELLARESELLARERELLRRKELLEREEKLNRLEEEFNVAYHDKEIREGSS